MTEKEIKEAARIMAMERLACHTHNMALRILMDLSGMTGDEVNEIEQQSLEKLRMLPAPGLPPHLSDVVADETFHELKRLLEYAREMRETPPR